MKSQLVNLISSCIWLASPAISLSTSFELDFGSISSPTFGNTTGSTIEYGIVGNDGSTDIYGRLTSLSPFLSKVATNNGSATGDVRVNAVRGQTAELKLELFSNASYSSIYTNSSSFIWNLVFYDIDGFSKFAGIYGLNANEDNYFDEITLYTPGTLGLARDSALSYRQTADGFVVSAAGQDSVAGQHGVTSLNSEQQRYSATYFLENVSLVRFDYTVRDGLFPAPVLERNLLIDGGTLEINDPVFFPPNPAPGPAPTAPSSVPVPTSVFLMLASLLVLSGMRCRAF